VPNRFTMTLDVPLPAPQVLRGVGATPTFELCEQCYAPVLKGHLDDHLRAIPHRPPPLGQQSPEG
jgi:hypothetical protein